MLKIKKLSSLMGVYLTLLPNGVVWYWGNMSVYTNSWFRSEFGPDVGIPWVISLVNMGFSFGVLASGKLIRIFGVRWNAFFGIVLIDSAIFLSYFTVQYSEFALSVTMGLFTGLGHGCITASGLLVVCAWFSDNVGCATGAVLTSTNLGAMVVTQMVTAYINPDNLAPDIREEREKFFRQKEVLDAVPSAFLLLGIVSLCVHVVGFALVRKAPTDNNKIAFKKASDYAQKQHIDSNGEKTELIQADGHIDDHKNAVKDSEAKNKAQHSCEKEPKAVLKTIVFYVLWVDLFFADYSVDVLCNYYKQYGQLWIKDDHLLADLGTYLGITNMASTFLWGILIDKFGVKNNVILLECTLSISFTILYFTPMLNKWIYFLWTMLCSASSMVLFSIFPVVTLKMFGQNHYTENYSLLLSALITLNIIAPKIMMLLVQKAGWFYLFLSSGLGSFCGLVGSVVFFPNV